MQVPLEVGFIRHSLWQGEPTSNITKSPPTNCASQDPGRRRPGGHHPGVSGMVLAAWACREQDFEPAGGILVFLDEGGSNRKAR